MLGTMSEILFVGISDQRFLIVVEQGGHVNGCNIVIDALRRKSTFDKGPSQILLGTSCGNRKRCSVYHASRLRSGRAFGKTNGDHIIDGVQAERSCHGSIVCTGMHNGHFSFVKQTILIVVAPRALSFRHIGRKVRKKLEGFDIGFPGFL